MSRPGRGVRFARIAGTALLVIWVLFLGRPPTACADDPVPLDRAFRGQVVAFNGKTVSLRYDFRSEEQLRDWEEDVPFPIEKSQGDQSIKWFDQRLEIQGNTGAQHIGVWKGDVEVTCRLTSDAEKNIGAFLATYPESEDFATFTLVETFFHGWDGSAGGTHSIIKFGKQWRERGADSDFIGFRYVQRRSPPDPLRPGSSLKLEFGIKGGVLKMKVGDLEMKGKDRGKRLKRCRPGLYTIGGRSLFDDVIITGKLDSSWMKEKNIAWKVDSPVGEVEADPDTLDLIDAYEKGESEAADLVKVVADGGRPERTRRAAANALSKGSKKAVRAIVDLLYSEDEVARELGAGVVKALLGKTFGYKPKGSEKSRSAAIRKLNQALKDHPELLED